MPRHSTPEADALLDVDVPVLDHGIVRLVDYMGGDQRVVDAARTSYGDGTKTTREDRGLLRYLISNRHCYRGDMQVLTAEGWKRWDECDLVETFLVPDPITRKMSAERLPVEVFDVINEQLHTYTNSRMSYAVTADHRMWFRPRGQDAYAIIRAHALPEWGHFDPLNGYGLVDTGGPMCPRMRFVGFYLGNGGYGSDGRVSFHLRKDRKKEYLTGLLDTLEITYEVKPSSTYPDAVLIWVHTPDWLWAYTNKGARASNKSFTESLGALNAEEIRGLYDGLVNSDGSIKQDRPQIQYSSTSPNLLALFETLAAMQGVDAHRTSTGVTAYHGDRTSLEARKQYFSHEDYSGKVYCATTSTGLLMVRGGPDKYGFVCGNTSPFEQTVITFYLFLPIFIMRQIVRHRTARLNEWSGRYSIMPDAAYMPSPEELLSQGTINKQGGGAALPPELAAAIIERLKGEQGIVRHGYGKHLNDGLAREMARINLPLAQYTACYWQIDSHNLMHFLRLRLDSHAQPQVQAFARPMAAALKAVAPMTFEAFEEYVLGSRVEGRTERDIKTQLIKWAVSEGELRLAARKLDSKTERVAFLAQFDLEPNPEDMPKERAQ